MKKTEKIFQTNEFLQRTKYKGKNKIRKFIRKFYIR